MKTQLKSRIAEVAVSFSWDEKLPFILSVNLTVSRADDGIRFDEHDGTSATELAAAFAGLFPAGAKIESNGRNEAWVSFWDDEELKKFDKKSFDVIFEQVSSVDEYGNEEWLENRASLRHQSRFVAYAISKGNSPARQIEEDEMEWPGGVMTGFILWIREKTREFREISPDSFMGDILINHEGFDNFLNK